MIQRWVEGRVRKSLAAPGTFGISGTRDQSVLRRLRNSCQMNISTAAPANTNKATVTARDDEGGSATANDTASVRFVDYGQIAPTGVTCQQYVNGAALANGGA